MRILTALVVILSFQFGIAQEAPVGQSQNGIVEVLNFSQWKERQVALAHASVEAAKMDLTMGKSKKSASKLKVESTGALTRKTGGAETAEARLSKALLNLDVAKGLDLKEYVMLYLSEQNDSERIAQAVRQLNADEIGRIVQIYKQNSEKSSSALKDPVALEATR